MKVTEYKIGHILCISGFMVGVIEVKELSCTGCFFNGHPRCDYHKCCIGERRDRKNVSFILLDK